MGLRPKSRGHDPITHQNSLISYPTWRHSTLGKWQPNHRSLSPKIFLTPDPITTQHAFTAIEQIFPYRPFRPLCQSNFLLTYHLKQFALGIIIPDHFNQREKRLMHNLVSSRAGRIKKIDRRSATLFPLTPLDNLPGLCTTILETEVSFLLDSGSLFNLINGPLLDLICEETRISFSHILSQR